MSFALRLREARNTRIILPHVVEDESDRFACIMRKVHRAFEDILRKGDIEHGVGFSVTIRQDSEDPSVGWFSREFSPDLRQKLTLALAKLDVIIDSVKSVGGNVRRWEIKMHVVEDVS